MNTDHSTSRDRKRARSEAVRARKAAIADLARSLHEHANAIAKVPARDVDAADAAIEAARADLTRFRALMHTELPEV